MTSNGAVCSGEFSSIDQVEIDQVRVIVYAARNIYRKNEKTVPLCVVFGIGGAVYRTEFCTARDPTWNESQEFTIINDAVPLRMWLKQGGVSGRSAILGKVTVAVHSLPPESQSRELVARFQWSTDDDQTRNQGYLLYECCVTKYRRGGGFAAVEWLKKKSVAGADYLRNVDVSSVCSTPLLCCSNFTQRRFDTRTAVRKIGIFSKRQPSISPIIARKLLGSAFGAVAVSSQTSNEFDGSLLFPMVSKIALMKTKSARIDTEVFPAKSRKEVFVEKKGSSGSHDTVNSSPLQLKRQAFTLQKSPLSVSHENLAVNEDVKDNAKQHWNEIRRQSRNKAVFPLIMGVTPSCGSVWGGTRLKVTGRNLGVDADDVIGLYVCGSNCISTMEFESSERIRCTTKPWSATKGAVTVITASGGRSLGRKMTHFSFVADDASQREQKKSGSPSSASGSPAASSVEEADPREEPDLAEPCVALRRRMLLMVDEATQTSSGRTPPALISGDSQDELVNQLHNCIAGLKHEKAQLQEYVDTLVARVLNEVPNALCVKEHRLGKNQSNK